MFVTQAMLLALTLSWLSQEASCFSPAHQPISALPWKSSAHQQKQKGTGSERSGSSTLIVTTTTTLLRLSQSVNDHSSGFHYDQEPRGTSYISQVSKQDLWERRQMRGPGRSLRQRARQRQPAPNSRGAFTPREYNDAVIDDGNGGQQVIGDDDDDELFDAFKDNVSTNLKSMTNLLKEMQTSQSVQTSDVQALSRRVLDMAERISLTEGKGRSRMTTTSSTSIGSMEEKNFGTPLDGEFNQKIKDVIDEFDMVQQGAAAAAAVRDDGSSTTNHNMQDGRPPPGGGDGPFYREKIAQLEARIDEIDDSLRATEDKFRTQMEYVDIMLVNERFDDNMDDNNGPLFDGRQGGPLFDDDMRFQQQPPPPQSMSGGEPFMDDGPMPPPQPIFVDDDGPPLPPPMNMNMDQGRFERSMDQGRFERSMRRQKIRDSSPPPSRQQEILDDPPPPFHNMDDNGRTYYQERNNMNNNFSEDVPSTQKQPRTNSVNTRSGTHHYNEKNNSFMSSFSKMDNERRREFQPFSRDTQRRGVNEVRQGDQLPRGVANAPNRGYALQPPPPNSNNMNMNRMGPPSEMNMMGPEGPTMNMNMIGPEQYFEEQFYYNNEDGPPPPMNDMMMGGMGMNDIMGLGMEEDYFYNDMY